MEQQQPEKTHATFLETDNLVFWALTELIKSVESTDEMNRVARYAKKIKHLITEDQWNRLTTMAKERRKALPS